MRIKVVMSIKKPRFVQNNEDMTLSPVFHGLNQHIENRKSFISRKELNGEHFTCVYILNFLGYVHTFCNILK